MSVNMNFILSDMCVLKESVLLWISSSRHKLYYRWKQPSPHYMGCFHVLNKQVMQDMNKWHNVSYCH